MRSIIFVLLLGSVVAGAAEECRPTMATAIARAKRGCQFSDRYCTQIIDYAALTVSGQASVSTQDLRENIAAHFKGAYYFYTSQIDKPLVLLLGELGQLHPPGRVEP